MAKVMKKAEGGTKFGMLSVKAGIDKNPNPRSEEHTSELQSH